MVTVDGVPPGRAPSVERCQILPVAVMVNRPSGSGGDPNRAIVGSRLSGSRKSSVVVALPGQVRGVVGRSSWRWSVAGLEWAGHNQGNRPLNRVQRPAGSATLTHGGQVQGGSRCASPAGGHSPGTGINAG